MDADDRRALLLSLLMAAVGLALIALALWMGINDLKTQQGDLEPHPGPSPSQGALWPSGAPAWAHTCDGLPPDERCPLPFEA